MKLSSEQKTANKEVSLLLQAAYRARCKELEQAKLKINVISLEDAAKKARAEEDVALKARNDEEDAICEQISLLQEKLKNVRESHSPILEAARMARNAAYGAMYSERERQANEIEACFPDLFGNSYLSSGAWIPPAGYIERYASDNAAEISKKKTKREKTKKQNVVLQS